MQLKDAIKKRKSVRKFTSKKPDWRKIIRAIDMARFSPAAGNQFSLKFILISDEKKIEKISDACQQDFVKQVHYIVAVVSDDSRLKKSYDNFGEKFARQQAGAAMQNFFLALTELGLATCWVGWYSEDQIKRELKIPESLVLEAIFPIGIETKVPTEKRIKPELDTIIYFDKWNNKKMEKEQISTLKGI